jgi:hypothetical protein
MFHKNLFFSAAVLLAFLCLFYGTLVQGGCDHVAYVCSNGNGGCGGTLSDVHTCATRVDQCAPWQICNEGSGTCYCNSKCLNISQQPKDMLDKDLYYDNPEYENDLAHNLGDSDIKLPVKLDWIDGGWENVGGSKTMGFEHLLEQESFGVKSFWIKIEDPDHKNNPVLYEPETVPNATWDGRNFVKLLDHEYFNEVDDAHSCFFRTESKKIVWHVRACCNKDGTNCGPWTTWDFSTDTSPEPISPKDPDWNGPKALMDQNFKGLQVKWCKSWVTRKIPFGWAKSYRLMVTSDEQGQDTQYCHPLLVSDKRCRDEDILKDIVSSVDLAKTGEVTTAYPIQGRNDLALFTRDRLYAWKMKTCFDESASECSNYGQTWKFSTLRNPQDPIGIPAAVSPKDDPSGQDLASLPLTLTWSIPDGANSFIYQATFFAGQRNTTESSVPNKDAGPAEKGTFDAPNLKPDTQYKWRVKACSKFDSTDCDEWSKWFTLRTTGRSPKEESLAVMTGIPATFVWEAVPGAKSYRFSLFKSGGETKEVVLNDPQLLKDPKYTVGYPDIDQEQSYTWKVQTCTHEDGTVCGQWSKESSFTAVPLLSPANVKPQEGSVVYSDQMTQDLSWEAVKDAAAYRYTLELAVSNEKEECAQDKIEKTVSVTNALESLRCLGSYRLAVQACADSDCKSLGPESATQFTLDQRVPASKGALSICGAGYDNPDTSWNERESCQPKHLALFIKVVLDFLLFRLAVILLPILALITGLIFYSSFKTPEIWEKVKKMWKAIGIGYALLIFAWTIVGIVLQIAGFSGLWWKIL